MSEGIDAGTFAHHGESYALGRSLEAERSAPKRVSTQSITAAPIDTAREINCSHRRVFEQATRERLGNIRTLRDVNARHRALWKQLS